MRLAWIDRRGHVEPLRLPVGPYEHPRIAPDGRHVAYDTDDGKDAIVWVYDLSGGRAPRRLTFGGRNRVPVWSPDGASVAFQSDREGDAAIDAAGQLADGTPVNGVVTLRQAILKRPETFVRTMTEKMMTYALGRGLMHYDLPVVRGIVRQAAVSDYRFSSLVLGIVDSVPFQMRRKG